MVLCSLRKSAIILGVASLTHIDEGEITEKKVHWGVQSRVCDHYEDDKDVSQDRSSIKHRED